MRATSLEEIDTPGREGYALGWDATEEKEVRFLRHAGSNTTSVCQILMAPSWVFAVVVMSNRGDPPALQATADLVQDLARRYGY